MKLLLWLSKFFQPTLKLPRAVKFFSGTEMQCPRCRTTLAIARRDVYYGDLAPFADWDVKDAGFLLRRHCDAHTMCYDGETGRALIMTPTGWVG